MVAFGRSLLHALFATLVLVTLASAASSWSNTDDDMYIKAQRIYKDANSLVPGPYVPHVTEIHTFDNVKRLRERLHYVGQEDHRVIYVGEHKPRLGHNVKYYSTIVYPTDELGKEMGLGPAVEEHPMEVINRWVHQRKPRPLPTKPDGMHALAFWKQKGKTTELLAIDRLGDVHAQYPLTHLKDIIDVKKVLKVV